MIKTSIPMDYKVECPNPDCLWWGTIAECDTERDQDGWEMPEYWYYACPACGEPIDI